MVPLDVCTKSLSRAVGFVEWWSGKAKGVVWLECEEVQSNERFLFVFIYFWLCRVSVASRLFSGCGEWGSSLAVVSGAPLWLWWLWAPLWLWWGGLLSGCGEWGSSLAVVTVGSSLAVVSGAPLWLWWVGPLSGCSAWVTHCRGVSFGSTWTQVSGLQWLWLTGSEHRLNSCEAWA